MKKISETIQLDGKPFDGKNMSDLYAHLLEQAGKEWPDKMIIDCNKVEVSSDIRDMAYDAFMKNLDAPENQCDMYWIMSGPFTNTNLPPNTIILFDGYLKPEKEIETDHTVDKETDLDENAEI